MTKITTIKDLVAMFLAEEIDADTQIFVKNVMGGFTNTPHIFIRGTNGCKCLYLVDSMDPQYGKFIRHFPQ